MISNGDHNGPGAFQIACRIILQLFPYTKGEVESRL